MEPNSKTKNYSILELSNLSKALITAFKKLSPRNQLKNPVMFVVFVGALLVSIFYLQGLFTGSRPDNAPQWFILNVAIWLWITVIFANFAEAVAEGRGKAQADSLKLSKKATPAKKLAAASRDAQWEIVDSSQLKKGDLILVESGEIIPGDGQVIQGVASVDESAITGESAPVVRESGGDRTSVTGGTKILSDWLIIEISANPGESFLDKMISMVEGAKRQKTPNEIALSILLAALTIVFLLVCVTLYPFSVFSLQTSGTGQPTSITVLIALLICLAPTTIGGLLSAIGIAGMDRLIKKNVIAMSGRAVEAAGDIDVLLLDKTGTITHGNRQASKFYPISGVSENKLWEAALFSSLADDTPEGKSIVQLTKTLGLNVGNTGDHNIDFIPFSAHTRISGADVENGGKIRNIRKGAADSIKKLIEREGKVWPQSLQKIVDDIAIKGGTPLVVCENFQVLGAIELKDIVKTGINERFKELRRMGIKTVMITGDNPLTAAAISADAGVDEFLAEATPETKLKLIKDFQKGGRLVAMTGDGTNDAPALAQADVAVVMNSGTQAAKEAGNMIDLDSNPTKLIEIVKTGKQLLMTRGALTTFSVANDIAKYFAIIPAAFVSTYPVLGQLNLMGLKSAESAILSAVIFNALVIIALVPLALRGVELRLESSESLLRRNLLIYGLGGVFVPFVGIKIVDEILGIFNLV